LTAWRRGAAARRNELLSDLLLDLQP